MFPPDSELLQDVELRLHVPGGVVGLADPGVYLDYGDHGVNPGKGPLCKLKVSPEPFLDHRDQLSSDLGLYLFPVAAGQARGDHAPEFPHHFHLRRRSS